MGWKDNTYWNNEGSKEKKGNNEREVTVEEEKKERDKELREAQQQKWQKKRDRRMDYENNIGTKAKETGNSFSRSHYLNTRWLQMTRVTYTFIGKKSIATWL